MGVILSGTGISKSFGTMSVLNTIDFHLDAGEALAEGAEDAGQSVSLAAFACADAFSRVTADSIQMHGGIAFTWVNPVHLYLRRARADAQLFGTPAAMRERFVQQLGG